MNHQVSPFAALTGMEKQMKWLEYQSIQLPYVEANMDASEPEKEKKEKEKEPPREEERASVPNRPAPPPEVPRVMPVDTRSRHGQYDAVIARMKQAALQSSRYQAIASELAKQPH